MQHSCAIELLYHECSRARIKQDYPMELTWHQLSIYVSLYPRNLQQSTQPQSCHIQCPSSKDCTTFLIAPATSRTNLADRGTSWPPGCSTVKHDAGLQNLTKFLLWS